MNRRVVFAAIDQNPKALQYASIRLRDDEAVVLAAVRQDGLILEWASYTIKNNNQRVVLAAFDQNRYARW